MAPQPSRHSAHDLHLAEMIMSTLRRLHPSNTAYPYQQDEVFNAVEHVSRSIHQINKRVNSPHTDQNSSQLPSSRQQIWHAAMTAKYTDMTSPDNRSIAHGVYIPRDGGHKSLMSLNNDPAAELQWLSHFSEDATSPFHNPHVPTYHGFGHEHNNAGSTVRIEPRFSAVHRQKSLAFLENTTIIPPRETANSALLTRRRSLHPYSPRDTSSHPHYQRTRMMSNKPKP